VDFDREKELVAACRDLLNYCDPPLGYLEVIGQRRARGSGTSLGAPDAILYCAGQVAVIEFKRPDGRLRPAQETARRVRAEHGVETHIIRDLTEFTALLNRMRRQAWQAGPPTGKPAES
jgi:hypothetical protein